MDVVVVIVVIAAGMMALSLTKLMIFNGNMIGMTVGIKRTSEIL